MVIDVHKILYVKIIHLFMPKIHIIFKIIYHKYFHPERSSGYTTLLIICVFSFLFGVRARNFSGFPNLLVAAT